MHDVVQALLDGNEQHVATIDASFEELQDGQAPEAVTVCCSDSRVLQDHLFSNDDPGHLFTCGNIGNRVVQRTAGETVVSGDVLYPLAHTGTDVAVVVGHTGCGAVTATYDHLTDGLSEPPGIDHCVDLLADHLEAGVDALPDDIDREEAINRLVEYNVDRQIEYLESSEHVPAETDLIGVVYDFQDVYTDRRGELQVINVDGETDPETLRDAQPAIESRIRRLWTY
ncbi:IcfA [Halorhabdus sp. CBA1104]|uniref:carbonic anhydrase n=1 Tax=unclassified Halorhabdus TaxID=2621901 RepID=UPI0012B19D2E|nr:MULTISPECIES: carbonic anhydrase [unclassified Halorhabdus]QGN06800.1 IcfA [Halorhabdus sp. CBA1104]